MAKKQAQANASATASTLPSQTLVIDNGAHTIKAGFSSVATEPSTEPRPEDCQIIANCIARSTRDRRTYVGPELLDECWDFGELAFRRPVEKGYVVNWDSEKAIWERSFIDGRAKLKVCLRGGVARLV